MKLFKQGFICIIFSLSMAVGSAQQIPMGQWRLHPSFTDTRLIESGKTHVYAASSKGLFRVNRENANIDRLSGMNGFHGAEVTSLTYSPELQLLLIGYADGFIDLLKNEKTIVPIAGFYNKLLQGDKRINHVSFYDKSAFVSTEFGILVIDTEKEEIRDSYTNIGSNGQVQIVRSTAVSGDSIYAGLPDGIIAAAYSPSVNLNEYTNWKKVYGASAANDLTWFADSLWFFSDTLLKRYAQGAVQDVFTQGKSSLAKIQAYNNNLYIFRPGGITEINPQGAQQVTNLNVLANGTVDPDGVRWFCTGFGGGLIKLTPQGEVAFEPNGPSSNSVFRMSQNCPNLYTSAGGVTNTFGNAYNPAGFYIYTDYHWVSNPQSNYNVGLYDYTYTTYNPVTKKTFIATHTNGMLELNGTVATNKYDDNNSPLFREPGSGFIRVSGLACDKTGNLWLTNFQASKPILMLNPNGVWTSISLDEPLVKNLIIDDNGYKWMILQNGGVYVFDDNKTPGNELDDRTIKLTTANGLITNDVLSLATDRNGYVWIGTSQGLNVVTNTYDVFKKPKADRFVIDQNGSVGYLLGEETINDICVDGGNRKWFATNNGVFLVEPNGQTVLTHFSPLNSPLPDKKVYCTGQISETGEMFFGTEEGIASYRSDASEASNSFAEIKIYPNPVKPGYDGPITIEGLAQDAEIRITDATGALIYQAKANGGTATWNGTRLDGSKPNSGVFYVFGINTEGTETAMGKFVFIR